MDSINNINRLLNVLRRRIGENTSLRKKERATDHGGDKRMPAKSGGHHGLEHLQRKIIERLQCLKAEEEHFRTAVQLFVESVLMWEFGEDAAEDPAFADCVRQLSESLHADEHLQGRLQGLFRVWMGT